MVHFKFTRNVHKLPLAFFILSVTAQSLLAQNIPANRKVDWSIAGMESEIPCASVLKNAVTEFGISNQGTIDVTTAVNNAINSLSEGEALYFPKGTYYFTSAIKMKSGRILRGESSTETILKFNFSGNNNCIEIIGSGSSSNSTITQIQGIGENKLSVNLASNFSTGNDVEIEQANDPALHGKANQSDLTSWATNLKGQMAKIVSINGNEITLDRAFTHTYDLNFSTKLKKVSMIEKVGIENLKIFRQSNNGIESDNNNIVFEYAKNCWVRKVWSENASRYHFRLDYSRNIEISECYLDKAFNCGSGGAAYGILTEDHASECLFENNIANKLRHPWITKEGATRNVYAYNFSNNTTQGDACDADPLTQSYADISIHGHYAAFNLFEGNVVYRISSSDFWGPAGPGNTFFRNKVIGKGGISILYYSFDQNVLGNDLTYSNSTFKMDGDASIGATTLHKYNRRSSGVFDGTTTTPLENSLYLNQKPGFYGSEAWPSIGSGTSFSTSSNPAQKRFQSDIYFTPGQVCMQTGIEENQTLEKKTKISFFPNPSQKHFTISNPNNTKFKALVFNNLGEIVSEFNTENNIFGEGLEKGIYLIKLQIENSTWVEKIVKE